MLSLKRYIKRFIDSDFMVSLGDQPTKKMLNNMKLD